jgi:putative ABC transport system ATP-binding protein
MSSQGQPPFISLRNLTKVYQMGEYTVNALQDISLDIERGEFLSIMGPSGSGKSTLMSILGALDQPTSGKYYLDGQDVGTLNDNALADIRNQHIGFVFQNFNLLPRTTALQQVELPLIYGGHKNRKERAIYALKLVGLEDRLDHRPNELSGGQQQRVAIARALVNEPSIILADEPTGNLDSQSGVEVMEIFQRLNQEEGITIVFVTHDSWNARHTKRVVWLADGLIARDEPIADPLRAGESERPSESMLL